MNAVAERWGPSFAEYIREVREAWRTLEGEALAGRVEALMTKLFRDSSEDEPWVRALTGEKPSHLELYRDDEFGFIQMGHYHKPGHGSPPHGHGGHWVVYGTYKGKVEIATYRVDDREGKLDTLDKEVQEDGSARAYGVGVIHSTRQLHPEGSVVLRFLSADLKNVPRERYSWDQIRA